MVRLVQFENGGVVRVGVQLPNGDIADITKTDSSIPSTMLALLQGGDAVMTAVKKAAESDAHVIAKSDATLKAPINGPEKIICIGMNYVDHCVEQGFPVPVEPIVFSKFAGCITDPGAPIYYPPETEQLDFEVELCIVVGKTAKRVASKDAMSYVAGYTGMSGVECATSEFISDNSAFNPLRISYLE